MARHEGWTRRRVLKTSLAGAAAAMGAGGLRSALAAPALVKGSKLTYWGGLIFSDKANKLLVDTINKWGADNGIQTEVVMINQNETVQKVSAAVASNTMPDALDLNLDLLLLLSRQGQFLTVDSEFDSIGKAQGGWFDAVAKATDTSKVAGGRTGIPFGVSGNLLLRRNDLLSKAGFTKPPTTWEELVQQAAAVNKPPLFGLGPRAVQCRRRQRADRRAAVLWRTHRRRHRHQGGHQVRCHPRVSALAEGRLGQEGLPAGRDDLGRRRRQPGLSLRTGRLHRQHRLGRHRGEDAGSGTLPGDAATPRCPAARRASSRRSTTNLRAIPKIEQEPGRREGAARVPRATRIHERLLRAGDLRAGAAEAGGVQGLLDATRSCRACSTS